MMQPRIKASAPKKLVGKRLSMSLAENRTSELWRSFMTDRREIGNAVGSDLYAVQFYPSNYFSPFDAAVTFEKWATLEVTDFDAIPQGMESLMLPAGLYAVFTHRGGAKTGPETFGYIFGTWLPDSIYILDDRPHFEILSAKYKNDAANSEEEIWIPVRPKAL